MKFDRNYKDLFSKGGAKGKAQVGGNVKTEILIKKAG